MRKDTTEMAKSDSPDFEKSPANSRTIKLTLIYIALGGAWILLSDLMLEQFIRQSSNYVLFQSLKGILYVGVTAVLVYWLANRAFTNIEQRVSNARAEEMESLLKAILANLGEAVFLIDPPTRTITACNSAVSSVFGYDQDELIGRRSAILHVDTESFQNFGNISEPVLEQDGVFRCRYRMKRKDGTVIDTENTVVTLHRQFGWRKGVVSIVRDISGQVRFEKALQGSEERYRLLADNTLDVIWSMDTDLRFTYVNPAIERHTGHTPKEFVGTSLRDHCTERAFDIFVRAIEEEMQKREGGTGVVLKNEILRKDGTPLPVEVHGRVLYDADGKAAGLQGTSRDISERLALEAQVRQAQKMESIGTLAAGVAHEINNPVMGITGYAEMIEMTAGEDSKFRVFAGKIKQETERVHAIVRNLLGFARREEEKPPGLHDVREFVDATLSLFRTVLRKDHIELELDIPDDLPAIPCHMQKIQQVIMNLLTNARDALNLKYPESDTDKKIRISARRLERDGGRWVRVTVEDHGTGIPEEIRERVYEPFYTTKPEGSGTGLGLWISYGIVREHQGRIEIESREGSMTRIHLELPTELIAPKEGGERA